MHRAGFIFTMAAGFFSVFMLGWSGYAGPSADWVYGFLAVFWSLLMMLRLMTLTEPAQASKPADGLAQKIIDSFRLRQEENRQLILENAFGGSFIIFISAGLLFAAWQIYCAAFPSEAAVFDEINSPISRFLSTAGGLSLSPARLFSWGQGFLLFLSFCMMGFVLRSHSADRSMTRPALLILCMYAVAAYIIFLDIAHTDGSVVKKASLVGNGHDAAPYLLGSLADEKSLSFFDILLLEGGLGGLGIMTFLVFIPLCFISFSVRQGRTDWLVVACGVITGLVLIMSVFLTFTPAVGGLMALCIMALFLAWGASENNALPSFA